MAPGERIVLGVAGINETADALPGAQGMLDTKLAGVRILFDGIPAPILYVRRGAVGALAPYSVAGRQSVHVQLEYLGKRSNTFAIPVVEAYPVILQDQTLRAHPGSTFTFYINGAGETDPPGVDGKVAPDPPPRPVLPVSVRIGGLVAQVLDVSAALGEAGVTQINVRVPEGELTKIPYL